MPRETVLLTRVGDGGPESVAILLSWLAYPGPEDEPKRSNFLSYAVSSWLRRRVVSDPHWGWQLRAIPPALLCFPEKKAPGVLSSAQREISRKRLPAAVILRGLLIKSDHLNPASPISWLRPPVVKVGGRDREISANMMAATVAELLNDKSRDWKNTACRWTQTDVMSRVWIPSKPVAHLAEAVLSYIEDECNKVAPNVLAMMDKMNLSNILDRAEDNRFHAIKSPSINISDEETISFRFE